jgi:hypothetical protein
MDANIDSRRLPQRYACIPWQAAASRTRVFGATLARARRTARAKRAAGELGAAQRPLEGPPPEVQRELDAAARVAATLAAQGKELRFATREDGRVSVELADASGHLDVIGPTGLFQLLKQAS